MSEIQKAARILMASKLLADAARSTGNEVRADTTAQMLVDGTERVRVRAEGGEDFGTVTLTSGRVSARVGDVKEFTAWVLERYPDQVETVTVVKDGFRDRVLNTAAKLGTPVDLDTGEVIPGVEVEQGEPYLTVRPTAEAKERMAALLADAGLLALPEAPDA